MFLLRGPARATEQHRIYATIKYSQLVGIQPVSNEIPKEFRLCQNYPNPFNPITRIKFDLASFDVASVGTVLRTVHLTVFDILGREVGTLVNEPLKLGSYEVSFDASNYTSGIYFYRLTAGDYTDVKKMMFVK